MSDHHPRMSRLATVSAHLAMFWFMAFFALAVVCVLIFISRKSGMEFLFANLVLGGNLIAWVVFGIPALITGLEAFLRIRNSRGRLMGYWQALGGMSAGIAFPAAFVLYFYVYPLVNFYVYSLLTK